MVDNSYKGFVGEWGEEVLAGREEGADGSVFSYVTGWAASSLGYCDNSYLSGEQLWSKDKKFNIHIPKNFNIFENGEQIKEDS